MNRLPVLKSLISIAIFGALSACQSVGQIAVEKASNAVPSIPIRAATDFGAGLRCMKNMLDVNDARIDPIRVTDIENPTEKVKVGGKAMMARALATIGGTRIPIYLPPVMVSNEERPEDADKVTFVVNGAFSRFDEPLANVQKRLGIYSGKAGGLGAASTAKISAMDLDLSVTRRKSGRVEPGAVHRSQTYFLKKGQGVDADLSILTKFGVNFGVSSEENEGTGRGARAAIEFGAIAIVGSLAKVPYWECIDVGPSDESIKEEVADWYFSLNKDELNAYVQRNLVLQDYLPKGNKPVGDAALRNAITAYRSDRNLQKKPDVDLPLFATLLGITLDTALEISPSIPGKKYHPGEKFELSIRTNRDAHVYCYWLDESPKFVRVFPNRFMPQALVKANRTLVLPGKHFDLVANEKRIKERLSCFATDRDVRERLPEAIWGVDIDQALPIKSFEQIRQSFLSAGGILGEGQYDIEFN